MPKKIVALDCDGVLFLEGTKEEYEVILATLKNSNPTGVVAGKLSNGSCWSILWNEQNKASTRTIEDLDRLFDSDGKYGAFIPARGIPYIQACLSVLSDSGVECIPATMRLILAAFLPDYCGVELALKVFDQAFGEDRKFLTRNQFGMFANTKFIHKTVALDRTMGLAKELRQACQEMERALFDSGADLGILGAVAVAKKTHDELESFAAQLNPKVMILGEIERIFANQQQPVAKQDICLVDDNFEHVLAARIGNYCGMETYEDDGGIPAVVVNLLDLMHVLIPRDKIQHLIDKYPVANMRPWLTRNMSDQPRRDGAATPYAKLSYSSFASALSIADFSGELTDRNSSRELSEATDKSDGSEPELTSEQRVDRTRSHRENSKVLPYVHRAADSESRTSNFFAPALPADKVVSSKRPTEADLLCADKEDIEYFKGLNAK